MDSLQPDSWKHLLIVCMLEVLFLAFSLIFVGHGITQWKKKRQIQHLLTAAAGIIMAGMSLYATVLLLDL